MNGKGDAPRPVAIDQATYAANWVRTFASTPCSTPASESNLSHCQAVPGPETRTDPELQINI